MQKRMINTETPLYIPNLVQATSKTVCSPHTQAIWLWLHGSKSLLLNHFIVHKITLLIYYCILLYSQSRLVLLYSLTILSIFWYIMLHFIIHCVSCTILAKEVNADICKYIIIDMTGQAFRNLKLSCTLLAGLVSLI